jgi:serine/threonine protein phosphatase PrpC
MADDGLVSQITEVSVPPACAACGATVDPAARFCEACGHELGEPVPAGAIPMGQADQGRWLSTASPPTACPSCGGTAFHDDDYCDSCGQRRPAGLDHCELDLEVIAGVTDRGKRHHHNEDAMSLGVGAGMQIGVVCDGVSTSNRPDTASNAAAHAAAPAMLTALADGADPGQAIITAARAAQAAAALAAGTNPGSNPPSCTFVCAVVDTERVTVGWVGDSRAYWLPETGQARQLTTDDSLAGQLAAAGIQTADIPHAGPATALVRWLGADAPDTVPHLASVVPDGPGRVLVCSDGLFRYRPDPVALAATTPDKPPLQAARDLVAFALEQGGQDNIAVVLLTFPPVPASAPSGGPEIP